MKFSIKDFFDTSIFIDAFYLLLNFKSSWHKRIYLPNLASHIV